MSQMSKQELSHRASQFAASLMREDNSNEDVIAALLEEGLAIHEAEFIVKNLLKIQAENLRREANNCLIRCGIGLFFFTFFILCFGSFFYGWWGDFPVYLTVIISVALFFREMFRYFRLRKEAEIIQNSMPKSLQF
jgi:hypothetical protein